MDDLERNVKGQFKYAARLDSKYTVVIGDDEIAKGIVQVKDMASHEQKEVKLSDLVNELTK